MKYSHDWFSQHIPCWRNVLGKLAGQPNLHFLEIGCFEGLATNWMLDYILTHETSDITVIDTFEGSPEFTMVGYDSKQNNQKQIFLDNTEKYRNKITILEGMSCATLPTLKKEQFDFIYVDGSHAYEDVASDLYLSFELLKHQGIMTMDDYTWDGVNKATDEFIHAHKNELIVLELPNYKVQCTIIKR